LKASGAWNRVARVEIDFPAKVSVGKGVVSALGLELSAMGVREALLVVSDAAWKSALDEVCESLSAARVKWGMLLVHPEAYRVGAVELAVGLSRRVRAVVALGCWPALALSKVLSARCGTELVAVPAPPGFAEAFSRMTVQPRGYVGPSKPLKPPTAIFVDAGLPLGKDFEKALAAEALVSALEALAVGWRNRFILLLAEAAVERLERSLRGSSVADAQALFEAAAYAALARGHSLCSALSSLARALFSVFGVDPYAAELALARAWVTAASRAVEGSPAADAYRRAALLLEEFTDGFSSVPTLPELGVGESKLDLAAEYAWTFEHHCAERDPSVSSRFSLRQLLAEACYRKVQRSS